MLKINLLKVRKNFLGVFKPSEAFHRFKSIKKSTGKNEYQKTLNLPNPGEFGLSMKNICRTEEKIKKLANFDTLYEWQSEHKKNKPKFQLHDGPPYANGDIHIGHMVNKVLKDIYLRYKLLAGYQVNYIPGWDCHGLPIELNAIKSLNAKAKKNKTIQKIQFSKSDPTDIRQYASEYAKECVSTQMNSFKEMNLLADWNKIYRTIDTKFLCKELDLFFELYEKKLIYRDYMPVYWSVSSQTALAEFELEYNADHKSESLYVEYKLDKYPEQIRNVLKPNQILYAPIWTTTPWSLPCNKAISFNPQLKYGILSDSNDEKAYLVAADLIEHVTTNIPVFSGSKILDTIIDGHALTGCTYISPFNQSPGHYQPLLPSDHVGSKTGTGLVHIAPALGQDDFKLAIKHNLATECVVNELGQYDENDVILKRFELSGLSVLDSKTGLRIKEILGSSVLHSHIYTHSYPYDWRTKKPCIIRSSKQWFIDTNKIKVDALEKLNNVRIRPSNVATSMNSTLGSRPYWCISRQRSWGLPIPCLYTKKNGQETEVITRELIENLKSLIFKEGNVNFWWTNKYDDKLFQGVEDSSEVQKSMDILDIWFDSGSSFNSVLSDSKEADLYCEGMDQFSGWFQSSLLLSTALNDQSPYKNLLVHGFVVDESNHKMSKSVGNVIEPRQAIRGVPNKLPECGLDTLRFWICHEYYKSHIQIGKNVLEKFLKRTFEIRSILRFVTGNLNDLNYDKLQEELIDYESLLPIDKILLSQLSNTLNLVVANYEDMNLNKSILQIESFFITQLSSFYINSVRDRLYCESANGFKRRSAQTALYHVLCKSLMILGPIMPHLSEEAFHYSILKRMGKSDDYSLFRSEMSFLPHPKWDNKEINELFLILTKIRGAFFEIVQSEKMSIYTVNIECCKGLHKLLETNSNMSDSWLIEAFGCSSLSYKQFDSSDNSLDKKTIDIDGIEYSFRLTASKNEAAFICNRCRRYASGQEDTICPRCSEVIGE